MEAADICAKIDAELIDRMAARLAVMRKVYVIGLGGSMANAIHMAADLRKLCDVDAEAFDNVAEITARANDEGFDTIFFDWLRRATRDDALFVLSVGGGTKHVSTGIALSVQNFPGAVMGIVGPDGGMTVEKGDPVIRVPVTNSQHVTPHTEAFQAVVWHALVSHPLLQKRKTKW